MYHTYFNQTNAMGFGRVTKASDAFEGNWTLFGCGFVAGTNGLNCSPPATSILFYAPMALGPGTPNTRLLRFRPAVSLDRPGRRPWPWPARAPSSPRWR